ncbi:FAS1-like dehydratase domain-containing protein [Capillimicrobium parvum]|uniref:FAS1-like dehydratase domain-containing protein n=1 Tax=Capillimicrobium parvum TaxID=2884022 RepID=A0A9E6XXD6_9ACTN|nr:MaoC family dehydratase N-terminal domain-containing protein [Capillimicrobium parvum]UGS35980.1 hypothetical protein DSM104329_02377 [Capillimicrobium parvum]
MSVESEQRGTANAPGLTDDAIATASKLLGRWLRRDVHWPAVYEPISLHDIRRWAIYSVGDDNPLWRDEEYAKRTIWGEVIAPPTFLFSIDTTIVAPGLPGIQWIHGGTDWELFRPVRVGDRITARGRLINVVEKEGRRAPRFIIQEGETLFEKAGGELVGRAVTQMLRIPRARSGQGMRSQSSKPRANGSAAKGVFYTEEQIAEIDEAYANEVVRGAEPRYWEDVEVGEQLPPIVKGPLTLVDIVAFFAGRRFVYSPMKMAFAERRKHPRNVYVSPQTGIPVHPAAGHFDNEIAREIGMPRAYDQGFMRINWLGHLVTNWAGDHGVVRKLSGRNLGANLVGDLCRCHGVVVEKMDDPVEPRVVLDLWGENQDGVRSASGSAEVVLPTRRVP